MRYKGAKAEFMMRDNESKILQVIKENPDIQHSRLIEIVEGKNWMVKKTAEDALNRLVPQKRVMVIPVSNRKHYRLPEYSMSTNVINERSIVETQPVFLDDL